MTQIGNAVLSEYVSEINERIEDDKTRIRVGQVLSTGHSFWRLWSFSLSLFFNGCLVLVVLMLFFIDAETLDMLRIATNEEILSGISTFLGFTTIVAISVLMFITLIGSRRYFHDKKQERLDREQEQADLIQTIIQVNEELLLRHKLIDSEVSNNG